MNLDKILKELQACPKVTSDIQRMDMPFFNLTRFGIFLFLHTNLYRPGSNLVFKCVSVAVVCSCINLSEYFCRLMAFPLQLYSVREKWPHLLMMSPQPWVVSVSLYDINVHRTSHKACQHTDIASKSKTY